MRGHSFLIGRYLPGDSVLHRTGYLVKLIGMFAVGLVCTMLPLLFPAPWAMLCLLGLLGTVMAVFPLSYLPPRLLLTPLRPLWPVLLALASYQLVAGGLFQGRGDGVGPALQLLAILLSCVYAAILLSVTTPVSQMLDGLTGIASRSGLHRLGLDPERFALTVSLMMRSIPCLMGSYADVRNAAKARGLERSIRAHALPTAIAAVALAEYTAEALAARGLGD